MKTWLTLTGIIPFCASVRKTRVHTVIIPILWGVILFGPCRAPADEPGLRHVTVFTSGEGGYHTIRIPALEVAPNGTLLAFAEGRRNSSADPGWPGQEIDLLLKTSRDGGRTWSPIRVIEHSGAQWSSANPATVVDKTTGRIWLFYIRCAPGASTHRARPGSRDVLNLARFSDDHGEHWSDPVDLTPVARDMADKEWGTSVPGPGGGIQLSSGRLAIPMWRYRPFRDFVLFSDDHGPTWQRGGFVSGEMGVDECQLVQLADGRLALDMRQQNGPHRWISFSRDGGQTWSKPRPGQQVTPVCCAVERWTSVKRGDDRNRIAWTGPRGPGRNNLTLWISYDELETFQNPRLISEGPGAYSDLAVLPDKSLGILWEKAYQEIIFTSVPLSWVEQR